MYDIAIIGGGISGLMAAYRLTEENAKLKVAVFEKGHNIGKRRCPIIENRNSGCLHCKPCNIMEGAGGAGAFSDGKYVISTEYGGWLTDVLSPDTVMGYIEQADAILCSYGATKERYAPDDELKKLCIINDLHMQQGYLKHLGTDDNLITMQKLIDDLSNRCEIICDTAVTDVKDMTVTYTRGGKEHRAEAKYIIFAVGRSGSEFFQQWCRDNGVSMRSNQVDIGVRVELPAVIWEYFSKRIYEPKIWYRSKLYGDITRMFCFNEGGFVVTENTGGILTVNGHAFKNKAKKSGNSNFALLSTLRFTQPFNEPIRYAKTVAALANQLSGNSVLVQRLGDLMAGRRPNSHRPSASPTYPTLKAP
ncbi:MAG: FAD-dependent oxidoreductase, partial [Oscillospiraceae bacterium]|nr:FAD-dependent oxidoreductase [Oscillospiraceae bacterium]